MTVDNLAVMVAKGFEDAAKKTDALANRVESLSNKTEAISNRLEALNSNVKNYLALSERPYSELKQRDALLAQWIKLVAAKTKVPIDVSQLEKI